MEKYVVIMAGGVGSRFWPRSRKKSPKQLLNIIGDYTMIQETYYRVKNLVSPENVFIITNKVQKVLIEEQLPEIPAKNIIAEPVGKNTAPCIGLAAKIINNLNKDSVFVTLPADHIIKDENKFLSTLNKAIEFAESSKGLLTFGITPARPETGYGYINFNKDEIKENIHKVKKFVEKPDLSTAEMYLESGEYLWNSGMFIWRSDVILEEIQKYLPAIYKHLENIDEKIDEDELNQILASIYPQMDSVSIDYGIMEKSEKVYVMEGDFGWSDVGSWETVYELNKKDNDENALVGDTYVNDVKNSYIYSPEKFTAVIGVENLLVINTDDALLVCKREQAQEVKKIVDNLNREGRDSLT